MRFPSVTRENISVAMFPHELFIRVFILFICIFIRDCLLNFWLCFKRPESEYDNDGISLLAPQMLKLFILHRKREFPFCRCFFVVFFCQTEIQLLNIRREEIFLVVLYLLWLFFALTILFVTRKSMSQISRSELALLKEHYSGPFRTLFLGNG